MVVPASKESCVSRKQRSKVPEERRRDREDKLLSENRRLRKQVAQLQKRIAKIENREIEVQEIIDEYEIHSRENEVPKSKPQCPMCGSYDVAIMEKLMNETDYYSCNTCKARGKYR